MSYFGPQGYRPPGWARRPAAREPVYSQAEKRQRRILWLPVEYGGEFDLAAEVTGICEPAAAAMKEAVPRPLALAPEIEAVAGACHDLCSGVVAMLVEHAEREPELVAAVRAFAAVELQVSDDAITSGSWAADLMAMVAPFSAPFSALLGRALPPRHPQLRSEAASDRLVAALRPLDTAAHDLSARIPKAAQRQALGTLQEHQARSAAARQADRAAERLSRLGMTP